MQFQILALMLFVFGCASTKQKKCKEKDWRAQGVFDAKAGFKKQELQKHLELCKEFDIEVDEFGYLEGWQTGLEELCSLDQGFVDGQKALDRSKTCPLGSLKQAYQYGFLEGKEIYYYNIDLRKIDSSLSRLSLKSADPNTSAKLKTKIEKRTQNKIKSKEKILSQVKLLKKKWKKNKELLRLRL